MEKKDEGKREIIKEMGSNRVDGNEGKVVVYWKEGRR